MKKLIVVSLVIACAGALYFAATHFIGRTVQPTTEVVRIAIFTPITHPALEEIEQGFTQTMQKLNSKQYAFTTFNANGNRTLLRAQAEEIVGGNYDLVFTLGASCSQTVAELLKKKDMKTPQLFAAVDSREFAESLRPATGVYVDVDYTQEMDVFNAHKPGMKNILLVYDPLHGTGLEKYKKQIEEYIKKFGITLHSVEIYQTNEIQQKVAALLPGMDAVLVLIDNTVVAGIDALIVLCNRYGVTLLVSDLASGQKGAALAYGFTEYESGSDAAYKANAILAQQINPQEVAISAVTNFRLEINKNTAKLQGITNV